MEDPRGRAAGFHWPQYSMHRGALQMILLQARVVATFCDKANGERRGSVRGDLLIGADGIHSTGRARLYLDEGRPGSPG
jgi:2-polyprenyl-6-methoxyphenol hydroxylase-like FAD-dependent oxidoreductase